MTEIDSAIEKYQNNAGFHNAVNAFLVALRNDTITVDDLRSALKLAILRYDREKRLERV